MDNFYPVDVVRETKDVDFDTSYENNTSDGEAREDFEDEFTEDDSQRQNFSRNMLLKSFRHKVEIKTCLCYLQFNTILLSENRQPDEHRFREGCCQ